MSRQYTNRGLANRGGRSWSSNPVNIFKMSLPRGGLAWPIHSNVLKNSERDQEVRAALEHLGVRPKRSEYDAEFANLINIATAYAKSDAIRPRADGLEKAEFVSGLQPHTRLAGLRVGTFSDLLRSLVRARQVFKNDDANHDDNPSALAKAIDGFVDAASWYWRLDSGHDELAELFEGQQPVPDLQGTELYAEFSGVDPNSILTGYDEASADHYYMDHYIESDPEFAKPDSTSGNDTQGHKANDGDTAMDLD